MIAMGQMKKVLFTIESIAGVTTPDSGTNGNSSSSSAAGKQNNSSSNGQLPPDVVKVLCRVYTSISASTFCPYSLTALQSTSGNHKTTTKSSGALPSPPAVLLRIRFLLESARASTVTTPTAATDDSGGGLDDEENDDQDDDYLSDTIAKLVLSIPSTDDLQAAVIRDLIILAADLDYVRKLQLNSPPSSQGSSTTPLNNITSIKIFSYSMAASASSPRSTASAPASASASASASKKVVLLQLPDGPIPILQTLLLMLPKVLTFSSTSATDGGCWSPWWEGEQKLSEVIFGIWEHFAHLASRTEHNASQPSQSQSQSQSQSRHRPVQNRNLSLLHDTAKCLLQFRRYPPNRRIWGGRNEVYYKINEFVRGIGGVLNCLQATPSLDVPAATIATVTKLLQSTFLTPNSLPPNDDGSSDHSPSRNLLFQVPQVAAILLDPKLTLPIKRFAKTTLLVLLLHLQKQSVTPLPLQTLILTHPKIMASLVELASEEKALVQGIAVSLLSRLLSDTLIENILAKVNRNLQNSASVDNAVATARENSSSEHFRSTSFISPAQTLEGFFWEALAVACQYSDIYLRTFEREGPGELAKHIEVKDIVKIVGAARVLIWVGRGVGVGSPLSFPLPNAAPPSSTTTATPMSFSLNIFFNFLSVTSLAIQHACDTKDPPIGPKRIKKCLNSIVSLGLSMRFWAADVNLMDGIDFQDKFLVEREEGKDKEEVSSSEGGGKTTDELETRQSPFFIGGATIAATWIQSPHYHCYAFPIS